MTDSQVRVRFAPSPTGMFHVGGARSALFNWVLAKQSGGVFFLRIEDTDASRNAPEWVDGIINAMSWLGMTPDEYDGPHFQSEFAGKHTEAVQQLAASGLTYYCDCTREVLIARTGDPHKGYDGHCRDRGLTAGPGRALRFRTPDEGTTVVKDLVRGTIEFDNSTIQDFIIARTDGSAMFLLANVVDDMTMGITHVIRAEEHLPNAPRQQLLWEALGAIPPIWAHVSILVDEQRKKLSKRKHKVAVEDYRAEGFLADAMRNYLMLLGWSPGDDREILPWETIEADFRLENVTSSPAFFDVKKLRAFNGEYIRALPLADFIELCRPWLIAPLAPWAPEDFNEEVFAQLAEHAQSRIAVLSEITVNVDFAFLPEPVFDEVSWAKAMKPVGELSAIEILDAAAQAFRDAEWSAPALKAALEQVAADRGLKLGKVQAPVRVAVTGRTIGLPLFESLAVLGPDRALARIAAARQKLSAS
ncbi:MAG: glutamate--tRNA ligase [Corynebacteriales bacterium]|nr:glutamate--tRNA ligase [Mycobacteriales bacterium]